METNEPDAVQPPLPEEPPLPDEPPMPEREEPVPEPGERLPDEDAGAASGQDQAPVDASRSAGDPEVLGARSPQGGDPTVRDPEEWVTGADPATEAQKTFLDALAREAGEEIPAEGLTKAQASEHIDRLQARTGRPPRQG